MPSVIADTSPLQYLHQLELLDLLQVFYQNVLVPPAVAEELRAGQALGVNLPNIAKLPWITIPNTPIEVASIMDDRLGLGEREAIAIALSLPEALLILDDALARQSADRFKLRITGTLGILLRAQQAGEITNIEAKLDQLVELGFRLAPQTKLAVLKLSSEFQS